jgi:hypothetical protein
MKLNQKHMTKFALASESVAIPEGFELANWGGQTCFANGEGIRMGLLRNGKPPIGWGVLWLPQTIEENPLESLAAAIGDNLGELAAFMLEAEYK